MRTRLPRPESGGGLPPAVIVGLDCITGLQTARVLADRGVPVIGVAERPDHFACRTNAVARVYRASTTGEALVSGLERLAHRLPPGSVLMPCTDAAVLAIARAGERLATTFAVSLPDAETVEMLMDKDRFADYAEAHGLPVPRTRRVHHRDDLDRVITELRFPVVVKPRLKTPQWLNHARAKALRAASPDELRAIHARVAAWTDVLVVQEWVEGGEEDLFSCNCYYDRNGRPVVTFVARKLRQWPPDTGTSCLGEECRNDAVRDATLALFDSVQYRGLGYVELKRDARTGEHFIIEPNVGRPTGRSTIAEAGGVPLHYAAYCETAGLPLPEGLEQRYGEAKWIYLRHDIQASLYRWRRGELTFGAWRRSITGVTADAVFRLRDPKPFIGDLTASLGAARRAIARRRTSP